MPLSTSLRRSAPGASSARAGTSSAGGLVAGRTVGLVAIAPVLRHDLVARCLDGAEHLFTESGEQSAAGRQRPPVRTALVNRAVAMRTPRSAHTASNRAQ